MLFDESFLGHTIAWLCLIFRICGDLPATDSFLAYIQCYNLIPQPSASAQSTSQSKSRSHHWFVCTEAHVAGRQVLSRRCNSSHSFASRHPVNSTFWNYS